MKPKFQHGQLVSTTEGEGRICRKGKVNDDTKGRLWWVSMNDSGMIHTFFESQMTPLEETREIPKNKKSPPQVETIFPTEDFTNDRVLSDAYREEMLK